MTNPVNKAPLSCRAVSKHYDDEIELAYYPDGYGWYDKTYPYEFHGDREYLPVGTIGDTGYLIFDANWDTEKLVVREEYDEGSGEIDISTYTLKKNEDGLFELELGTRASGALQIQEALYFIQAEDGMYAMKIIYGTDYMELWTEADRVSNIPHRIPAEHLKLRRVYFSQKAAVSV